MASAWTRGSVGSGAGHMAPSIRQGPCGALPRGDEARSRSGPCLFRGARNPKEQVSSGRSRWTQQPEPRLAAGRARGEVKNAQHDARCSADSPHRTSGLVDQGRRALGVGPVGCERAASGPVPAADMEPHRRPCFARPRAHESAPWSQRKRCFNCPQVVCNVGVTDEKTVSTKHTASSKSWSPVE